jgi:hypothetical protein
MCYNTLSENWIFFSTAHRTCATTLCPRTGYTFNTDHSTCATALYPRTGYSLAQLIAHMLQPSLRELDILLARLITRVPQPSAQILGTFCWNKFSIPLAQLNVYILQPAIERRGTHPQKSSVSCNCFVQKYCRVLSKYVKRIEVRDHLFLYHKFMHICYSPLSINRKHVLITDQLFHECLYRPFCRSLNM